MAISIKVQKQQLKEAKEALKVARDNLSTIDSAMAKVSIMLDRWVQKNFRTEGGNVGGWRPFKIGGRWITRGNKRVFDSDAKLLQDTGRLRASFQPFATKHQAGIGSALDYSEKHEMGIGVPVRRMLPEKRDVDKQVTKLIETHVTKGID